MEIICPFCENRRDEVIYELCEYHENIMNCMIERITPKYIIYVGAGDQNEILG
jgi:hypothetical protein